MDICVGAQRPLVMIAQSWYQLRSPVGRALGTAQVIQTEIFPATQRTAAGTQRWIFEIECVPLKARNTRSSVRYGFYYIGLQMKWYHRDWGQILDSLMPSVGAKLSGRS